MRCFESWGVVCFGCVHTNVLDLNATAISAPATSPVNATLKNQNCRLGSTSCPKLPSDLVDLPDKVAFPRLHCLVTVEFSPADQLQHRGSSGAQRTDVRSFSGTSSNPSDGQAKPDRRPVYAYVKYDTKYVK